MIRQILLFVSAFLCATLIVAGEPRPFEVRATASVTAVTVYFSGAEITHTVSTALKKGNGELIIENIANDIDAATVRVKAPAGVTISGVAFANNYLPEKQKTPRVRILTDSLHRLQQSLNRIDRALTTLDELRELLKTNRDIRGQQTGIQVAELSKMVDYYKKKMLELQEEQQSQLDYKLKLTDQISRVEAQLKEESSKNLLPAGRLILQLAVAMGQQADFTVSYLAKNAAWTPFFDIKVQDTHSPMQLISKAQITQNTGIDWHQVQLSLSSARPSRIGTTPELQPWRLGFLPPPGINSVRTGLTGKLKGIQSSPALNETVVVRGYGTTGEVSSDKKTAEPLYIVDGKPVSSKDYAQIDPNQIKELEVIKADQATALYGSRGIGGAVLIRLKSGLEDYVQEQDKNLSLVYKIDLPYDLPASGKAQTAVIKIAQLPATYHYVAVPTADQQVYLTANITNWQQQHLLAGAAHIIFDNAYVGKTFLNPDQAKDTLSLTIASDERIAITKELLTDFSKTRQFNNYTSQSFTYEITLKNNKNEAAMVRLNDRIPVSTHKTIEVVLEESSGAQVEEDKGMLHWQLSLQPGEKKTIRFSYTVRYPKGSRINL